MTAKWWEALPFQDRDKLALRYRELAQLPGIWESVAQDTRGKKGVTDAHAGGLASGLEIAADQVRRLLAEMDTVMPKCPHGKSLLATCTDSGCLNVG